MILNKALALVKGQPVNVPFSRSIIESNIEALSLVTLA